MIKINLLESVTDRPSGAARVEDKVTSPGVQTLLLALTVFGLLVVGAGYDYMSANGAKKAAEQELAKQQHINQQMIAVNKEQEEVEKKTKEIQSRIDAIKKLRESQQGPGSVLREVKVRFDAVPGLYLSSIEQKDGELTIKGLSPNETSVTRFGQSLEFSSGMFSNLNIETQRETAKLTGGAAGEAALAAPEIVSFTVKCHYGASKPLSQTTATGATDQVAMKK
jgi:Tfp pilus assembly protein PilN